MEVPVAALSDMAREVRKNGMGYDPYAAERKDRTPEALMIGGAGLGVAGALGVNNAAMLPKRTKEAIAYHRGRADESVPKAVAAKRRAANASRMNPAAFKMRREADKARIAAGHDLKNLRANRSIMHSLPKHQLRSGVTGGALLAAGAGLAALGSKAKKRRDGYESA